MKKLAIVLALGFAATPAFAASDANVAEARRYFDAGQKAFAKTKYGAAIAAFQHAMNAAPHPAILFSLAQAHRLRYFIDRDDTDLVEAATLYRRYLNESPDGRRRQHAVQHLAAIEPLIRAQTTSSTTAPSTPKTPTRLMVQVNVDSATVRLDGADPVPAPLIEEVEPGRHKLRVDADGYYSANVTRTAAEGAIAVVDVELDPKPAEVALRAPEGSRVFVDNRPYGDAPLDGPVYLPEGRHRVEVLQSGRRAYARDLVVDRGAQMALDVELESTTQRTTALWMLAGSGALVVLGTIASGVAIDAGLEADDIARKLTINEQALTAEEIDEYNDAKVRKSRAQTIAVPVFGVAAVGLAVGSYLYFFDDKTPGIAPAVGIADDGVQVGVTMPLP